jgi:hypothetical protein
MSCWKSGNFDIYSPQRRKGRKEKLGRIKPGKPLRSLRRAIPGAPPAGALRASNFVPDKIVRLCGEN